MSPATVGSQYVNAKTVRNREKNRYPNILPGASVLHIKKQMLLLTLIQYQYI